MRESEIIIIIFKYNFTYYKKHLWYIFLNFESIVYTHGFKNGRNLRSEFFMSNSIKILIRQLF